MVGFGRQEGLFMLHMLATLVSLFVLFGAGSVIATSLAERKDAIGGALGVAARPRAVVAVARRTRVRWYNVKPVSLARPLRSRSAA